MLKKKYQIIAVIILFIFVAFMYFYNAKYRFHLNAQKVYKIEYKFDSYNGDAKGETTDRLKIEKVVKYLNSLSLPIDRVRKKGATSSFVFKDKDNNILQRSSFGCEQVYVDSSQHAYVFSESKANKVKNILVE